MTGQPVFVDSSGSEIRVGEVLEADDPANYHGEIVGLSIVKRVNGSDANDGEGLVVDLGERLVFTYEVTNSGNVDLARLAVTDDILGAISCPTAELAAGATITCTRITSATSGTVTNIGTATA